MPIPSAAPLFYTLLLAGSLAACGQSLNGKFISETSGTAFDFRSDHRVEITVLGNTRVGSYELKDGELYISSHNEVRAFKFDAHGCIDGGFLFGGLCKQ
jgi:hypothetical protein